MSLFAWENERVLFFLNRNLLLARNDGIDVRNLKKAKNSNSNVSANDDEDDEFGTSKSSIPSNKSSVGEGCVVHLGAHLAELVTINEGNPDYLPQAPHNINVGKLRLLARSVRQVARLQKLR